MSRGVPQLINDGLAASDEAAAAIASTMWFDATKDSVMTTTLSFPLEIKELSERQFEGYGAIFGNVDAGRDLVARGAFAVTLAQHRKDGTLPLMFWMHRPDQIAGAWLQMKEDKRGLFVKGELADTPLGNEIRTLLQMKAVRGLSIGYRTIDADYNEDGIRILKEVQLMEVSIVSLAMNPIARVESVKTRLSHDGEYVLTARDFEKILRDAGISRKVALLCCAKLFDGEDTSGMLGESRQRDSDDVDEQAARAVLRSMKRFATVTRKLGS